MTMKTAHFATCVAMQNARRLSDSGDMIDATEALLLGGILLVTLIIYLYAIYKA